MKRMSHPLALILGITFLAAFPALLLADDTFGDERVEPLPKEIPAGYSSEALGKRINAQKDAVSLKDAQENGITGGSDVVISVDPDGNRQETFVTEEGTVTRTTYNTAGEGTVRLELQSSGEEKSIVITNSEGTTGADAEGGAEKGKEAGPLRTLEGPFAVNVGTKQFEELSAAPLDAIDVKALKDLFAELSKKRDEASATLRATSDGFAEELSSVIRAQHLASAGKGIEDPLPGTAATAASQRAYTTETLAKLADEVAKKVPFDVAEFIQGRKAVFERAEARVLETFSLEAGDMVDLSIEALFKKKRSMVYTKGADTIIKLPDIKKEPLLR